MNFSFFTVFLKNRNISSKIKRSKVTDYAGLNVSLAIFMDNPSLRLSGVLWKKTSKNNNKKQQQQTIKNMKNHQASNGLTHLCLMEFPTVINWTNPF